MVEAPLMLEFQAELQELAAMETESIGWLPLAHGCPGGNGDQRHRRAGRGNGGDECTAGRIRNTLFMKTSVALVRPVNLGQAC